MEWVETTGKTVEEAKELALDELGVAADEAEFEVVESPRPGLFGRLRGEARVRARVLPADVRPKRDRRRRGGTGRDDERAARTGGEAPTPRDDAVSTPSTGDGGPQGSDDGNSVDAARSGSPSSRGGRRTTSSSRGSGGRSDSGGSDSGRSGGGRSDDARRSRPVGGDRQHEQDEDHEPVDPEAVGVAAVGFVEGLVGAMGLEATTRLDRDGSELEVVVEGTGLGLLIGPGGQTLLAAQSLARVAAQRRLGDHDTRLRLDVAGYRAKRKVALEQFVTAQAAQVVASGTARSLEPMPSADRKIVHDALTEIDGVESRSVGDDPDRRVIITPVTTSAPSVDDVADADVANDDVAAGVDAES
ncbi:MAG: Jag N-terminal domain-containing protein [Actinomycetota bacterium]|nr:Jag N-terminal domain-containing protein [Actinomycetota bacterium]